MTKRQLMLTGVIFVSLLMTGHAVWDHFYASDNGKSTWQIAWDHAMDRKDFIEWVPKGLKALGKIHLRP
ncbi:MULTISPECIES: hypothetical protein [unclassified Bradyrhizobium]|uniref:hypothetical protein n=1 Tax=unclassified Bradyrhizobium TaxID=2631580 RepID=UPI0003FBB276|nr:MULTISPECIES: hypothetical protein [unclassified Bradyrhizobium]MCP3466448.1 hypothetical protein [Bradyrhizobium sp. CCGUVB23]